MSKEFKIIDIIGEEKAKEIYKQAHQFNKTKGKEEKKKDK